MADTASSYSQTVIAHSARRSLELLLAPYLNEGANRADRLSETDLRSLAYAVLRMIDHVQGIDSFFTGGVSDAWFPFSTKTLPESLRSPFARSSFLKLQDVVLTKSLDLEREDEDGRVGKGGFGYVDGVISTIAYKEYARKLIPRGRTFKKNKEALSNFERELGHLKKLSHAHIVELIGSYTDPKFVGIIMAPVADSNLMDFLARGSLSSGDRSFLRTFFGCLAAALCYLHENKIRHKDIKPQNVLVKGHQVFLTDFGISLDWSELDQSTTTGVAVRTPWYCAPEVANSLPRNSLSDVWSLGCVFLEIWTILKGQTIGALYEYLELHGSKSTCYCLNCDSSLEWCRVLEGNLGNTEENPPLPWIRGMLQLHQDKRWTAQTLVDRIQELNEAPHHKYSFSGSCCIDADDSTVSGHSSRRSSIVLEKTGVFPTGIYNTRSRTAEDDADAELDKPNLFSSLTIRPLKVLDSDKATLKEVPVVREVDILGQGQSQSRPENRESSARSISANDTSSKSLVTLPKTRSKTTYYLGQLQGHRGAAGAPGP